MARDTYHNFKALKHSEVLNQDYKIAISDVGSPITIIAPHGGRIEPQTSDIAGRIAGDQFNCYCFEGIKANHNGRLHITSHHFDEPQALDLLARSPVVVAVHACIEGEPLVYPGGRNEALVDVIVQELKATGIVVAGKNWKYPGTNPKNICNRGATGSGAQLEFSRGLRDDPAKVGMASDAIRNALIDFTPLDRC